MTISIKTTTGQITEIKPSEKFPTFQYEAILEEVSRFSLKVLDNTHLEELEHYNVGCEEIGEYSHKKTALRNFAIEWQRSQATLSTSYEELALWSGFFEKYGKKYGLLGEFRENGII